MMSESFGALLARLRLSAGLSQNQLARTAGVDPAYVNRMERAGQTTKRGQIITIGLPARTIVCAMAQAMDLGPGQTDRLLYAAGWAPATDWQSRAIAAEVKLAAVRDALAEDDAEPTFIRRRTG